MNTLHNWQNMPAADRVAKARIQLLINPRFAFHSRILATLPCVIDNACGTAYTDGTKIGYNERFILSLSLAQLIGLLAHEAEHVALLHHTRRNNRPPEAWNVATDYCINGNLVQSGFELPEKGLIDSKYYGMASDAIYNILFRNNPPQSSAQGGAQGDNTGGNGSGKGDSKTPDNDNDSGSGSNDTSGNNDSGNDSGASDSFSDGTDNDSGQNTGGGDNDNPADSASGSGTGGNGLEDSASGDSASGDSGGDSGGVPWGEVRDLPAGENIQQHESRQRAINASAVQAARRAGTMPSNLQREIDAINNPPAPWPDILKRHLTAYTASDYTYRRPNRRAYGSPCIMPGMRTEAAGHIAIAIDTSGSIDRELLTEFAAQFEHIRAEVNPEKITAIYCDTRVSSSHEFARFDRLEFKPTGGGGTRFAPVFDFVADMSARPDVLLYFTDCGASDFDAIENRAAVPVLWLAYDAYPPDIEAAAKHGEVIPLR